MPRLPSSGGRYKTDGDKLIVNPAVSANPALVGTEQTYMIEIKGDRYQLKTAPFFSAIYGEQVVGTVVAECVKWAGVGKPEEHREPVIATGKLSAG